MNTSKSPLSFLSCFLLYCSLLLILVSKAALPFFSPFGGLVFIVLSLLLLTLYYFNRRTHFISSRLTRFKEWLHRRNASRLFFAILFIHFALRLLSVFVFQIDSTQASDSFLYVYNSDLLAKTGTITDWSNYYYKAPHQFWFTVFLIPVVFLSKCSLTAIMVFLALCSALSSYFLGSALQKQTNNITALSFMLLYAVLPNAIIASNYITHEHAFVLFLSFFLWLRFYLLPMIVSRPLLSWVTELFSLLILCVAGLMNGLGLVAFIATLILYLFGIRKGQVLTVAIKITAIFLLYAATHHMADRFQISHSQISVFTSRMEQYKWVLYMGGNVKTSGHYEIKDAIFFQDILPHPNATQEEIAEHHTHILCQRYRDLFSHPFVLGQHFLRKLTNNIGFFSHSYGSTVQYSRNPDIQRYGIPIILKTIMYVEAFLWGVLALAALLVGGIPRNMFYAWSTLFLVGATIIFLFTENASKYTISIQPFLYLSLMIPLFEAHRSRKGQHLG